MKLQRPQPRMEMHPRTVSAAEPARRVERYIDPEAMLLADDVEKTQQLIEKLAADEKSWYSLAALAADFATLFPDRVCSLNFEVYWESLRQRMEKYRGKNWRRFSMIAVELYKIFPERRAELHINEDVAEGLKQALLEKENSTYLERTQVAGFFVVLFPERRNEIEIRESDGERLLERSETGWSCLGFVEFIKRC